MFISFVLLAETETKKQEEAPESEGIMAVLFYCFQI